MADYFTHFSCMLDVSTSENIARALDIYRTFAEEIERDGAIIGFLASASPDDGGMQLWIRDDTTGDPEHVIVFVLRCAEALDLKGDLPVTFGGGVATPGKAVTVRLKEGFASVGSPRYTAEQTTIPADVAEKITALESEGKTVVVLLSGKTIDALIALRDEPREDAAEGVRRLAERGIRAVMLTGDNRRTADAIASQLGMDARAELLPDAKLIEIGRLKEGGAIAMVGDGINDAPALAAASVGIAMGGGTDVALETADAALLKNRVTGVAELIVLSQATLANIWQNITIALGLKAVFLVTTLFGVTTLWMAILADTGATVLVTANALRLLGHRAFR